MTRVALDYLDFPLGACMRTFHFVLCEHRTCPAPSRVARRLTAIVATLALVFATDRVEALQTDTSSQPAADNEALAGAALFPRDTTLFVHVAGPGKLVERVLEHPLREKIEELEQVRAVLRGPQWVQAKLALAYLEARVGEKWIPALTSMTGGGIHAGFDLKTGSVAIAAHADDEGLLSKTAGEVLGFARGEAETNGKPFKIVSVHNGKIADMEKMSIGRFGKWLLVSNKPDYLRALAERLDRATSNAAHDEDSLAGNVNFRAALGRRTADSDAWVFADLQAIRGAGLAPELFAGSTDEPAAELIFGGVFEALRDAPFAAASLAVATDRIAARLEVPFDAADSPAVREYLLGTGGRGRAPRAMHIPGLIAQVETYRDLGGWWSNKEALFPENVVAGLAQGDSQLSTVFGGVDFGNEVLGALQPGMRLLVKQQEFAKGQSPDIQLPAFALVTRLQNPADARRFRISFQSLVGLLNLSDDGMERPQIEIITSREEGIELTAGEYWAENDTRDGLFIYNFSPALAFQDDYMILSSSRDFAREIALATKTPGNESADSESNTHIHVEADTLRRAIEVNRQALVAQTMIDNGLSRENAESRVDMALEILKYTRDAMIDYRVEPQTMSLEFQLRFAKPSPN